MIREPRRYFGAVVAGLACAWIAASPSPARAYEEMLGLSFGAGYGAVTSDAQLPHHAVVAHAGVGVGLGDTFELRGLVAYGFHPGDEPLHRASLAAEIVYVVDILEVVPFFGVGAGGFLNIRERLGEASLSGTFELHAVVGFDWLLSREWSIGLEVRPWFLLTSLDSDPMWLTVSARAQILFEL